MKHLKNILIFSLLALITSLLVHCSHEQVKIDEGPGLLFMAYNVENLFDTNHDQGKYDYEFLPIEKKQTADIKKYCNSIEVKRWRDACLDGNWTEDLLREKLKRLSDVVLKLNQGKGPDVL